jgi:aconitate hydratase
MSVYDAAVRYVEEETPLGVLAGAEYGSGSSRDWAAKGPALLGVRFVLAESFERIHRQNLVGMGILPLQYRPGESAESHGLSGRETYAILGLEIGIAPGQEATVQVTREDGSTDSFPVIVRIDQAAEVVIFGHGGILPMVLREALGAP